MNYISYHTPKYQWKHIFRSSKTNVIGVNGMRKRDQKKKIFLAVTTNLLTCSESCCSFGLGVRTGHSLKLGNMSWVRRFKIDYFLILFLSNWFFIYLKYSCIESLGPEYGEACILDLEATWEESEPRTPLICMLSIGSDPSPQIATLAKQKNVGRCICLLYSWFMLVLKKWKQ